MPQDDVPQDDSPQDHVRASVPARELSRIDRALALATRALRALASAQPPLRPSPAQACAPATLDAADRRRSAALMRVNHAGEVCAQALYEGQALSAERASLQDMLRQMAREEDDHLAWCGERIASLGGRASLLNPVWYGASFAMGAAVGRFGARWNLGFVAATEERVCEHLRGHLAQLPAADSASRAVLEQMLEDEARHGQHALRAGGEPLPAPLGQAMSAVAKTMTSLSRWL